MADFDIIEEKHGWVIEIDDDWYGAHYLPDRVSAERMVEAIKFGIRMGRNQMEEAQRGILKALPKI